MNMTGSQKSASFLLLQSFVLCWSLIWVMLVNLSRVIMRRAIHDVKATDLGLSKVRFKAEVDFDGRVVTRSYLEKQDIDQILTVSPSSLHILIVLYLLILWCLGGYKQCARRGHMEQITKITKLFKTDWRPVTFFFLMPSSQFRGVKEENVVVFLTLKLSCAFWLMEAFHIIVVCALEFAQWLLLMLISFSIYPSPCWVHHCHWWRKKLSLSCHIAIKQLLLATQNIKSKCILVVGWLPLKIKNFLPVLSLFPRTFMRWTNNWKAISQVCRFPACNET